MAKWTKWIKDIDETLMDLILGCLIYSFIFELIGLLAVSRRLAWTLGIALGTITAVCMSISMYKSLNSCLVLDPSSARRMMTIQSILRMLVMLVVAWTGMKLNRVSFPAVIVGMLGLKVSAHLHMYTNVYITKRLRRKGR